MKSARGGASEVARPPLTMVAGGLFGVAALMFLVVAMIRLHGGSPTGAFWFDVVAALLFGGVAIVSLSGAFRKTTK